MKMRRYLVASIVGLVFALSGSAELRSGAAVKQPTFAAGSPIPLGPMAGEPTVGDVDADGNPDVVIACGTCCGSTPSPLSGHVQVLLGDGRGRFRKAEGSPIPIGPSSRKVALGDANRDGKLDIFVAQHDSYDIVVLLGEGRGRFRPAPTSPLSAAQGPRAHTHDISAADVNADGNIDLLTTNANDNTVSVMLGDGACHFAPAAGSPVRAGRHPYDVVTVHDVNGDGKLDLITPNLRGNAVMVMLGDGKGGFNASAGAPFPLATRPGYIAVGDLDRDGKLDLVATHDDYPIVAVLLGDGQGGFKPTAESPLRPAFAVWGVAIGDMNGDGAVDLVCGSQLNEGISILLGDGRGGFTSATTRALPAGQIANYVALADVNKDRKLDVIATSYGSGTVTIFLNTTR